MEQIRFTRLRAWEGSLDACIRCGYCFEHCPIFRDGRWETDAPRGKLILLHGMLNGKIRPAPYAVEKLFECFTCGQCEKACSSGVPVLKVLEAARADLADAGISAVGTTSVTDDGRCALCLNCVRTCRHEARSFSGKVITDRLKCASCGSCNDACPAGAVSLGKGRGTSPSELQASIAGFLRDPSNPGAKAIVLGCSSSSHPGLQHARAARPDGSSEYKTLFTSCTGRIKSVTLLEALNTGAWGVMIHRCPEDDCKHGGSARINKRVFTLRHALEQCGIAPARLQAAEMPKGNPKAFAASVKAFMDEIRPLGPAVPLEKQ